MPLWEEPFMLRNKIIAGRRGIRASNPPHTRKLENTRAKKTSRGSIQVRVSLSLRIRWIAGANPPYAVPYIDPPYGRILSRYDVDMLE